jgi:hypothetical protein
MELRSSYEVAVCAATQELPSILWNPKVYYRVHKKPPLVHIPSQIDPAYNTAFYPSNITLNIVHPPTFSSSYCSLSFWLSHQYECPTCISLLSLSCYILCPCHPLWLDHSTYFWHRVQVMKLLITQFFLPPLPSPLFGPNILLSFLFSNTFSLCSSLTIRDKVSLYTGPQAKLQFCIF